MPSPKFRKASSSGMAEDIVLRIVSVYSAASVGSHAGG